MFGLGMMEIGLIVVLAVMLFPAKELPKLVRSIARIYGQVRKTAEDFRNTVLEDEDLREPIDQIKGAYNDARWEVRDAERKARQQLAKAQMDMRMATARRIQADRETEKARETAQDGDGEDAGEGPEATRDSAGSAGPVRVAANEPGEDPDSPESGDSEGPRGSVASPPPRVIAARGPEPYTPPTSPARADDHGSDEPAKATEVVADSA